MAESSFDFNKFIEETKSALLSPAEYFSTMSKTGGFVEPLIKAVIYGTLAGIINFLWITFNLVPAFGSMFGGGLGASVILTSIIGSIIGLFIGGAIVLVISAICSGSTNYEENVRVTASLMSLYPVSAVFSLFTGINLILGGIVSLAVSLYGIWMLYNALIKSLNAKEGPAKVISIIFAVIPVLLIASSLFCYKAAQKLPDAMMQSIPSSEKQAQETIQKIMEEAQKQSQQQQ
ncbi:MAG TPA: YIP1 family protein [Spirochaetota bacterium]|nr:YIP1 family protein [Spirochaetota bacterium]